MTDFQVRLTTIPFAGGFIKAAEVAPREYRVYPSSFAETIEKDPNDFTRFVSSKKQEAHPYKNSGVTYTINDKGVPRKVVLYNLAAGVAYWSYHAKAGYAPAEALMRASVETDLKQALDGAFGNKQTDAVYQEERLASYESLLKLLKEAELRISTRVNDRTLAEDKAQKYAALSQMTREEETAAHNTVADIRRKVDTFTKEFERTQTKVWLTGKITKAEQKQMGEGIRAIWTANS